MIIGIDGNEANQIKRVGVGEYSFQVLTHLKEFLISTFRKKTCSKQAFQFLNKFQISNFKYQIYLKEKPLPDLPPETDWWQYRVVGPKFLWTQIGLPVALFRDCSCIDVFFTPTHYAPRFSPCPRVISIMDLSYLYFPGMFRKRDLWKLKNWTAYSVKKAKKILTISNITRDDIIKYYQIEPEKVIVTYPGLNRKLMIYKGEKNMGEAEKIRKKYKIDRDYLLYVGTLQPRKNLIHLIEAFRNVRASFKRLKLVIVGKKGWMFEEIFKKVNDLGLEKEVIFTGYVPEEELALIYQGARCVILVSLYEGFGFPVLEALSLGVPVVVSNVSSLPEIVGDAGILVNPYDVKDIARGIRKVISYDEATRNEMVKKGLNQAKKFSWKRCARETLKALVEVTH